MALEIPTATWGTFEVLATLSPDDDRETIACVDALQGNWITQRFNGGPSKKASGEPILRSSGELQEMENVHLVGYAIPDLRTSEAPLEACTLIEPGPLAIQALELLATRQPNFDTKSLSQPLYLRPPAVSLPRTPGR